MRVLSLLAAAVVCVPAVGSAQAAAEPNSTSEASGEGSEMELFELNDLLKKQTTVASTRALTVRESPGIVTEVSREEIVASGARDLLDVLLLVPGFSPGVDVEGVVDVGVRGIWGHEGKVLLLVDGIEMNELLYSTNQLGLHYPVDQIDSVEVIRGPGSVRYGGDAELAVINVKTLSAKQLQGADVALRVGTMDHGLGTRTLSALAGGATDKFGGLSLSIGGFIGEGERSDRDYIDPFGTAAHLANRSTLRPAFLNIGASWGDLHFRYIHDGYQIDQQDSYGQAIPLATVGFTADYADLSYAWKPSARFSITPRVSWKRQTPWEVLDDSSEDFFTTTAQRWVGSLIAAFNPIDPLTVTVGAEGYVDHAWLNDLRIIQTQTLLENDASAVTYKNIAALAEVQYQGVIGNVLGGLRYEHHSRFGDSLVPRFAYTKAFEKVNFKLLASWAFRAPGIENIAESVNYDIKPERTRVLEAEVGYAFTPSFLASLNVFDVHITDPIIYAYDQATDSEYYKNLGQTGSRGVEVDLHYRSKIVRASLNYSYANATPNEVPDYGVTDHPAFVLALPAHKLAFAGSVTLWRGLTVDPSLVFLGTRYGYVGDGEGGAVLESFGPEVELNGFVGYKDIGGSGLDVHAGVQNILDADTIFIQPYNGGHPPLPGPGREYSVRLEGHFH